MREENEISEDDWAAALNEAAIAEMQSEHQPIQERTVEKNKDARMDMNLLGEIPVEVTVELGRTILSVKDIASVMYGSVIELDGLAGEPMTVFANGKPIARGEVVVVNDKFGVRLTDIIS